MPVVQLEFWERKPSEPRSGKACKEIDCTIKHLIIEGQRAFVKPLECWDSSQLLEHAALDFSPIPVVKAVLIAGPSKSSDESEHSKCAIPVLRVLWTVQYLVNHTSRLTIEQRTWAARSRKGYFVRIATSVSASWGSDRIPFVEGSVCPVPHAPHEPSNRTKQSTKVRTPGPPKSADAMHRKRTNRRNVPSRYLCCWSSLQSTYKKRFDEKSA